MELRFGLNANLTAVLYNRSREEPRSSLIYSVRGIAVSGALSVRVVVIGTKSTRPGDEPLFAYSGLRQRQHGDYV